MIKKFQEFVKMNESELDTLVDTAKMIAIAKKIYEDIVKTLELDEKTLSNVIDFKNIKDIETNLLPILKKYISKKDPATDMAIMTILGALLQNFKLDGKEKELEVTISFMEKHSLIIN